MYKHAIRFFCTFLTTCLEPIATPHEICAFASSNIFHQGFKTKTFRFSLYSGRRLGLLQDLRASLRKFRGGTHCTIHCGFFWASLFSYIAYHWGTIFKSVLFLYFHTGSVRVRASGSKGGRTVFSGCILSLSHIWVRCL